MCRARSAGAGALVGLQLLKFRCVRAGARRPVESRPTEIFGLRCRDVVAYAAPGAQRGRLKCPPERERQLPRLVAEPVHRVQVEQPRDRRSGRPTGTPFQAPRPGRVRPRQLTVAAATSRLACSGQLLARTHHVRLEQHALESDPLLAELGEHRALARTSPRRARERVVTVHQHLGLDDRHDACFLAQRGVARQSVGVHVDADVARDVRRRS